MHYDKSYQGMTRKAADAAAIRDLQEWLKPEQWTILLEFAEGIKNPKSDCTVKKLFFLFEVLLGVQGYPIDAFCRTYCPAGFDAYLAEKCSEEAV